MFGFNVNKLKPNLKMAVHRIGIIKNKKAIVAKAQRKEVAALLAEGKEEKARIRVGILAMNHSKEEDAIEALAWCCCTTGGRHYPRRLHGGRIRDH